MAEMKQSYLHFANETIPVFPGQNQNVLIFGSSGSGKTTELTPFFLSPNECDSYLLVCCKSTLIKRYLPHMQRLGWETKVVDFTDGENSQYGFDPLKYISCYNDINELSAAIVDEGSKLGTKADPYWDQVSSSLLRAIIASELVLNGSNASFANVVEKITRLNIVESSFDNSIETNLDKSFAALKNNSYFFSNWNSFHCLPPKTAMCARSTLCTMLDSLNTPELLSIFRKPTIDFGELGRKKQVIALLVDPFSQAKATSTLLRSIYKHAVNFLFQQAEKNPTHMLDYHVRIILDDAGASTPLPNLGLTSSMIRSANMSLIMLFQSQAQLANLYGGTSEATAILDNFDIKLFLGSTDLNTCRTFSEQSDKPLNEVLHMPIGKCWLLQRGMKPRYCSRYRMPEAPITAALEKPKKDNSAREEGHAEFVKRLQRETRKHNHTNSCQPEHSPNDNRDEPYDDLASELEKRFDEIFSSCKKKE